LILVDSNVLFDIVTDDPAWFDWSRTALEQAEILGPLGINDVVFAELSVRYSRIEDLQDAVATFGLVHLSLPTQALFLAGKAFKQYRARRGATKTGVLPDFFIGAHASVLGVPLLTRDVRRYLTYFPGLDLIRPAAVG
jgi:predicted nucleic acid-binding protein